MTNQAISPPPTLLSDWQVTNVVSSDIDNAIEPRLLKMSDEHTQDVDPALLMKRVKIEKTYALEV